MRKRYQVFVSSTYKDLKEQRALVIKHIHDMGHFPVGMEIFPASDQTQWEYIKSIIDDSDYYVLILGGCYGSLDSDGLSFTEKEYQYAVKKGLHVLVHFRDEVESLPPQDRDDDLSNISRFRSVAMKARLARAWKTEAELTAGVIISLQQAIANSPAIGWVRGDQVLSNKDHLAVSQMAAENARLQEELKDFHERDQLSGFHGIAGLNDEFTLHFDDEEKSVDLAWVNIWRIFGDKMQERTRYTGHDFVGRDEIKSEVERYISEEIFEDGFFGSIMDDTCFEIVEAQFQAYNYIKVDSRGQWFVTDHGEACLIASKIVKR